MNAEHRDLWAGWVALLVTGGLQVLLPEPLSAGPSWLVVSVVGVLAAAGVASELLHHRHLHRWIAHVACSGSTAALVYSIAALIGGLPLHRASPGDLLRSAALLWASNVLVFATWYWRLDAGGPHARSARDFHEAGAFLFPQMTLDEPARRAHQAARWQPGFVDYLFIAFNTSTAFSPTDVPVLARWAKVFMMIQSALSLTTLAVLAARAVNIF